MQSNLSEKIAQADASLQRKLTWIGRHDTRIAFVAGVSIAMLGVLANAAASIKSWNWPLYVVFGFAAVLIAVSLVLIYCSQYPKTTSRNSSLVFFGTIAELKLDEYKKRFKERTNEEYLDDLLCQVHINAEILSKKFSFLKASLVVIATSLIPWLLALYLSKLYIK
jgi:phosphoglycerol transferase MdoB-like AlkP superfamily enzyme